MTLQGYVDAVEPFQIRGWVFDKASPQRGVTVEILLHGKLIGSTSASLYREDLERGGIGTGDYAFIFNFDQKLEPTDILHVSARALQANGAIQILTRPSPTNAERAAETPVLRFEGLSSDPSQSPVFVLGAARSGTSAIAQALLKLSRYGGHQEGHLLDLMAHFSVALNKFYIEKTDECAPGKDTTVSRVPMEFFQGTLNGIFIDMMRKVFPNGMWIDKTPNSNMIYLAPRLRQIWPNSRFIFMKRRSLENLTSRQVKFPSIDFAHHCREWNRVMIAWSKVKNELAGAAIEIDQNFLKENPSATAEAIKKLLNLTDVEAERIRQAFEFDHPERTSVNQNAHKDISEMGWGGEQIALFLDICNSTMESFRYSTNGQYYASGFEDTGLSWV